MCDEQDESLKEEPDGQRPMKKARYVWQVKGKYHLKETSSEKSSNPETSAIIVEEAPEIIKKTDNESEESMNNNAIPTKNLQCANKACIEALIEHSDNIMDSIQIPDSVVNIDRSISDDIPITLVKPNPETNDFYLRKWQARQVAKGFVDNTINKVLETWMTPPFDVTDFVENCENDGQIEDEGILMAIQSHGLQSGIPNNHSPSNNASSNLNHNLNNQNQTKKNSQRYRTDPTVAAPCTCSHNLMTDKPSKDVRKQVPFHHRSDLDSFDLPTMDDSDVYHFENVQNHLLQRGEMSSSASAKAMAAVPMDDSDFLDAAVAVAIQKKGLTSYSYG